MWKYDNKNQFGSYGKTKYRQFFMEYNGIELSITTKHYPITEINKEQVQLIEDYILLEINKIDFNSNLSPKFSGIHFFGGSVIVFCVDVETANWLCSVIQDVVLWSEEKLQICLATDLIKSVKCSVEIPIHDATSKNPSKILNLLKARNRGLSFDNWRILDARSHLNTQELVISMDVQSFMYLKSHKYMLYFNSAQVKFHVKEPKISTPETELKKCDTALSCPADSKTDTNKSSNDKDFLKVSEEQKKKGHTGDFKFMSGKFGVLPKKS